MKCPDCDVQVPDTGDAAYDFLAFLFEHVGSDPDHRLPQVDGWDQTPIEL